MGHHGNQQYFFRILGSGDKCYIKMLVWGGFVLFFSFSTQSHAESSRNFVYNQVLDPKCAKLDQNSDFGHVRTCQDLSRRTNTYCKPAEILLFCRFYTFPFSLTNLLVSYEIIFPKQCLHVEGSYFVSIGIAYKSGIAGRRPRYLSLGT